MIYKCNYRLCTAPCGRKGESSIRTATIERRKSSWKSHSCPCWYDTIGIDTAAAIPLISFSGIGNKAAPTPGIKRRCRHIPHPFGIRLTLLSCRQSGAGIHKSTNLWSRVEHGKRKLPVKRGKCNLQSAEKKEPDSRKPTYIKTVLGMGYKFASGE